MISALNTTLGARTGSIVATDAYASLPSAANYPTDSKVLCTNLSAFGNVELVDNGTRWCLGSREAFINAITMPLLSPPTISANASGTANGASTFTTAVTPLIQKGYMYVPANTLQASHAAGWYYFEMSTTTAFIAYNNTWTAASGAYPTEPTSKTAFSGAVPGAAGNTSEQTALIQTIPANFLGKYGAILMRGTFESNNSAGSKTIRSYLDTQAFANEALSSSNAVLNGMHCIENIGNTANQRAGGRITGASVASTSINGAVDTTAARDYKITLQKSAATDYLIAQYAHVSVRAPV